jgi:hypothetical protein
VLRENATRRRRVKPLSAGPSSRCLGRTSSKRARPSGAEVKQDDLERKSNPDPEIIVPGKLDMKLFGSRVLARMIKAIGVRAALMSLVSASYP